MTVLLFKYVNNLKAAPLSSSPLELLDKGKYDQQCYGAHISGRRTLQRTGASEAF